MAKASFGVRKAARENYQAVAKKTPVGAGGRFAAVEKAAKAGGATNPAAVAAAIGRKKYGGEAFQKMAIAGKKGKK